MLVRTWFSSPERGSTSHCHTVSAASAGIAHTMMRLVFRMVRTTALRRSISTATPTPSTMVIPAVQAQKASDFRNTLQKYGSERIVV